MAKIKTAPSSGRLAFGSPGAAKNEPRKRPKQARSQQTVDVLLEATARVLGAHGFEWVILSAMLEHPGRLDDPRLVDEIVTLALGYLKRA